MKGKCDRWVLPGLRLAQSGTGVGRQERGGINVIDAMEYMMQRSEKQSVF